ncbi:hypothetical protein CPB84DRAFT_1799621 [Gymnopilus junonius]|uniref:Uncharacterized protein n=1 Tax=Gymnopilus junonius TaxID=109634 RepID=A0A9P5TGL2_GYMJU|nr:hypothetical protein CPB84DRAFT_1799621 [Gymnopilus junonius]
MPVNKFTFAKYLAIFFVISGVTNPGLAAPPLSTLKQREKETYANVILCPSHYGVGPGCITIQIIPGCFDLNNSFLNLGSLNKNVASAIIPNGYECTFSQSFGCVSEEVGEDSVIVLSGSWDFDRLPSSEITVNFTDLTSSFICDLV